LSDFNMERLISICKRKLPIMITLLLIGIVLLSAGNFVTGGGEEKESQEKRAESQEAKSFQAASGLSVVEKTLEERLESILGKIEGVGDVSVTLVLKNGPEFEYATNVSSNERKIKENDTSGGERITTETTSDDQLVLVQAAGMGGQEPVIIKEMKPEVEGVLVVAEGAVDPLIKAKLSRAVQTVLGIPAHTVSVWPMENER